MMKFSQKGSLKNKYYDTHLGIQDVEENIPDLYRETC